MKRTEVTLSSSWEKLASQYEVLWSAVVVDVLLTVTAVNVETWNFFERGTNREILIFVLV